MRAYALIFQNNAEPSNIIGITFDRNFHPYLSNNWVRILFKNPKYPNALESVDHLDKLVSFERGKEFTIRDYICKNARNSLKKHGLNPNDWKFQLIRVSSPKSLIEIDWEMLHARINQYGSSKYTKRFRMENSCTRFIYREPSHGLSISL